MSKNIKLPRIIQQTSSLTAKSDIEAATRLIIQSLQSQIAQLQASLTQMMTANATAASEQGYSTINTTTVSMTNKSGVARNSGDVVIQLTTGDNQFTTTTTANSPLVIGCVASDSADGTADAVAIDADGLICTSGVSQVRVNADVAAITAGDYLVSHTSAGIAVKAANAFAQGIFAIALEDLASGTDTIDALITPVINKDTFIFELLTPSDASTVELSELAYSSFLSGDPSCFIIDTVTGLAVFPTSLAAELPVGSRCSITAVGKVITNALADWTVSASSLACIYLPNARGTVQTSLSFYALLFGAFTQRELVRLVNVWTWAGLDTTSKTIEGAINENTAAIIEVDSNAIAYAIALG